MLQCKLGGFLSGQKLRMDEKFLEYQGPYGEKFKVPTSQIETVVLSTAGFGSSHLKIVGKGTELATAKLPVPWAEKAQSWILENLDSVKTKQPS